MRKSSIGLLLSAIIIGAVYSVVHWYHLQTAPPPSHAAALPPKFQGLAVGMTEQDVIGKLGNPAGKKTNPRFEVKTAQQWQALKTTIDAPASDDPNAPPSKAVMIAMAEYEHRIKDIWSYPAGSGSVTVCFDGTGHVIEWNAANATGAKPPS